MRFFDRSDGGRQLAELLEKYKNTPGVLVLALPRGGVPVGYEVAKALNAPLDVVVVRKLGVPGQEELAMGAIASGGSRVLNEQVVRGLGISGETIDAVSRREQAELERRERLFRAEGPALDVRGRTLIVVDDGLATGSTMRAAVASLRGQQPARIVVAVPTAAQETCRELQREADEVVCVMTPEPFYAVGLSYENFQQTSDTEVREFIRRAA